VNTADLVARDLRRAPLTLLEPDELHTGVRERLRRAADRLAGEGHAAPIHAGFALRHDQEAVFRNLAEYVSGRAAGTTGAISFCRIVLPPRTGKTVLAGHVIGRSGLTATVIVPTRVLVEQTCRLLGDLLPGVPVGALTGEERRVVEHGVNVTTYAMLQRLGASGLPSPIRRAALVFADEAHRAMTPSRMTLLRDTFDEAALRVGLTATPDYDADRRLGRFFPDLVHELSLGEAFALGLLAPVRVWVAEVDHAGSGVRMAAGDYDRDTLGRLMSSGPYFKAAEAFRYALSSRAKGALLCCATRQQAHDLHQYLLRHRPPGSSAPALLLGETSRADRDEALDAFERGTIDTLVQVGVLIEGWSSLRCKLLIDLAPSVSRVRAAQKYFRPMTRDGGAEAHIYVLLPTRLPALPTLPTDLFGAPAGDYVCGELVGEERSGGATRLSTVTQMRTPIAGVRLRRRILLSTILRRPVLRRDDRAGLERVLASCRDFDPADPPGLYRFRALLFHHPLFTGRGEALLEWLGFPATGAGYEQFVLRGCPGAVATRLLAEQGLGEHSVVDASCAADAEVLAREWFGRSGAIESWPPGRHAEVGLGDWTARTSGPPVDRLVARDDVSLIRELLLGLTPHRITVLERHYGLHGEPPRALVEIAAEDEVSRGRVGQIEQAGLYKLRRLLHQRDLAERSLDERGVWPRDRDALVYGAPEPAPARRDRRLMDAVHAALTESAAPCSISELADHLGMQHVDVARGLRGLVRARRALVTDDGYLVSSGSARTS
jgi:superfamily II DNA or RNA helicase